MHPDVAARPPSAFFAAIGFGGALFAAAPAPDLFVRPAPPSPIYHDTWFDLNKNGVKDPYEDRALEVETRITDLLGRLWATRG